MASTDKHQKIAVIPGAGPAGLTAAPELFQRPDVQPIFEADRQTQQSSATP
jgi:predicted NAD/FAD-binding protein